MKQTRAVALICAGVLVIIIIVLGLAFLFGNLGLNIHGYIALVLGSILTMGLATLLMGLLFFSNRSGRDRSVYSEREIDKR
jgi:uncharacterized membrane protein YbhN (UPF0104 family)